MNAEPPQLILPGDKVAFVFDPVTGEPVISTLARQLIRERDEARSIAAYWRDLATGAFSNSAALPWENSPTAPQS